MRIYFRADNFYRAVSLATAVTFMSAPRFIEAAWPWESLLVFFMLMILVAAAVTAWGDKGGMPGAFPARKLSLWGCGAALVLAALLLPLYVWTDHILHNTLVQDKISLSITAAHFPRTRTACLAWALAATGFGTLFLVAAPMSLMARLTRNKWAALVGALLLRLTIGRQQLQSQELEAYAMLFFLSSATFTVAAGWLFATFGYLPATLFALCMHLRCFLLLE